MSCFWNLALRKLDRKCRYMVWEVQTDPNFTFSSNLTRSLQIDKNECKRFKSKTENLFKKEMIGRKTPKKHPKSKLLVEYNNQTDFFQNYLFEEIIVIKIKIAMRFLIFCRKIHFRIGKVEKTENPLFGASFRGRIFTPGFESTVGSLCYGHK